MRIEELDYSLPPELIAQYPEAARDHSRLLVLDRQGKTLKHLFFYQLPSCLTAGDLLVLNDTRVFPARLIGRKAPGGGVVEVLLLREVSPNRWEALVKPGKRVRPDMEIAFTGGELRGRVQQDNKRIKNLEGKKVIELSASGSVREAIERHGRLPLPPYIKRSISSLNNQPLKEPSGLQLGDTERYQTVYARAPGAVAAPTAGLHFTPKLLEDIRRQGVRIETLTLHVGPGTFRPLRKNRVEDHHLEPEFYQIGIKLACAIAQAKGEGKRIIAVGTTTTRAMESVSAGAGRIGIGRGWADLFIYPGHRFQVVDAMLTNFHLPRSTLLALVYAFGGKELVSGAYRKAIQKRYRFYSYGDAMLIV